MASLRDSPEKLNYLALPDYPALYSRLKGGMSSVFQNIKSLRKKVLKSRKGLCPQSFRILSVREFANWLCFYNNLDVAPAGVRSFGKD